MDLRYIAVDWRLVCSSGRPPYELGSVGGFEFVLTARNGNVQGNPPFAKGWQQFQMQSQRQSQDQNQKQDKKPQDELPEWYHRRRSEVNCGKYAAKGRAARATPDRKEIMKESTKFADTGTKYTSRA